MGLTHPWENSEPAPEDPPEEAPIAGASARAREDGAEEAPHPAAETGREGSGELLAFPRAEATVREKRALRRARGLAGVWLGEAYETGQAGLDGSVCRARPPALRDMHARIVRAEWAGEVPALRIAGQAVGAVCLVVNALLYALAWATRRPVRLAATVALTVTTLVWGWPA